MDGMNGYSDFDVDGVGADFDLSPMQGVPTVPVSTAVSTPHRMSAPSAMVAPPPQPMPRAMLMPASPSLRGAPGAAPSTPRHIMPLAPPSVGVVPGMGAVSETVPMSHMLGMSVLLPAAGTIAGMKYAGLYGSLGGALGAGSLINAYRAVKYMLRGDDESDREAIISGTYALVGLGAAGYLLYRGVKAKDGSGKSSKRDEDDDDDKVAGIK